MHLETVSLSILLGFCVTFGNVVIELSSENMQFLCFSVLLGTVCRSSSKMMWKINEHLILYFPYNIYQQLLEI